MSFVRRAFFMLLSLAGGDIICLASAIGAFMLPSGQKGCRHGRSLCVHPPVPPSAAAHLQGRRQACSDCFCPQPHCSSWGLGPPLTPATMHILSKDLGEVQGKAGRVTSHASFKRFFLTLCMHDVLANLSISLKAFQALM